MDNMDSMEQAQIGPDRRTTAQMQEDELLGELEARSRRLKQLAARCGQLAADAEYGGPQGIVSHDLGRHEQRELKRLTRAMRHELRGIAAVRFRLGELSD